MGPHTNAKSWLDKIKIHQIRQCFTPPKFLAIRYLHMHCSLLVSCFTKPLHSYWSFLRPTHSKLLPTHVSVCLFRPQWLICNSATLMITLKWYNITQKTMETKMIKLLNEIVFSRWWNISRSMKYFQLLNFISMIFKLLNFETFGLPYPYIQDAQIYAGRLLSLAVSSSLRSSY